MPFLEDGDTRSMGESRSSKDDTGISLHEGIGLDKTETRTDKPILLSERPSPFDLKLSALPDRTSTDTSLNRQAGNLTNESTFSLRSNGSSDSPYHLIDPERLNLTGRPTDTGQSGFGFAIPSFDQPSSAIRAKTQQGLGTFGLDVSYGGSVIIPGQAYGLSIGMIGMGDSVAYYATVCAGPGIGIGINTPSLAVGVTNVPISSGLSTSNQILTILPKASISGSWDRAGQGGEISVSLGSHGLGMADMRCGTISVAGKAFSDEGIPFNNIASW